jgi:hypothetical protein
MQFILKLMQFAIIVLVVGSNGQYHWTPNGYAAGLLALFAAMSATVFITESLRLLSWLVGSLKHFNHH